jgi:hypothetical protein
MNKEVYLVSDIMEKLDISKNVAYDFIKEGHFPVLKVKSTYRIPIKSFDNWFNNL